MIAMNLLPGISVNMNLLQVFILVAEHLSFKEAAERVGRSQSAVSAQIKQLEDQLGVPLFYRTTRSVALTPYGEILLKSARQGINELNLGFRRLFEAVDVHKGQVTLSCSPTIAGTRLPAILKMFETQYSGVRVVLAELPLIKMTEAILAGDVDFGVGPVFPSSHNLEFEPVLEDPLMALVPSNFPAADKPFLTVDELAEMPVLMSTKTSVTRQIFEASAKKSSVSFITKYQCTQHQTLIAMAEAGLGIAVLPNTVASRIRTSGVRVIPLANPRICRQVAIITVRGQRLPPAASQLADLIRKKIDLPFESEVIHRGEVELEAAG
ncbi:LysR family transcriptional regulator [Agaricicola taiwanensis]|uniref:LysR family transcriptional regulator n=1 Tax=Agaricicola taiwanensis TaxID=591372 RepID=A0A8J2YHL0_9RHOB|nr:LysR family transcriptional regulator [Agaricicola taiwanensis]GGE43349.1 LysR family transcriptional regulator [Agaricicola taiwanensis]